MGDDQPLPGMGVFQAIFSVIVHITGKLVSVDFPWPPGPRNRVQLSANETWENETHEMNAQIANLNRNRNMFALILNSGIAMVSESFAEIVAEIVAFRSAKVAFTRATFAEQKATMINSQPIRKRRLFGSQLGLV